MSKRFDSVNLEEPENELGRDAVEKPVVFSTRVKAFVKQEIKEAAFYSNKSQQDLIEEAWDLWKQAHPEWDEKGKI